MSTRKNLSHRIEVLEQRIAPAALVESGFKQASFGANLLQAGQGLTTGNGAGSGQYLVYVEKGSAMVFITDLNNNSTVDPNEIMGVAAGDGLSLLSFVDIHGDIVTNLTSGDKLSDSDRDPSNNPPDIGGDGRVLLNSRIEKIELRSVQASDFAVNSTTDTDGDGVVDAEYLLNRLALSNYSIFGNILAGKGFGSSTGGLIIDPAGAGQQVVKFNGINSVDLYIPSEPAIGSILTGTKAGGKYFSFGISRNTDFTGYLVDFLPAPGQAGGDIVGVRAVDPATTFNINSIEAGDGGLGGAGGSIRNIVLNGDSSGYRIVAGNGGRGATGGTGGSISGLSDLGSVTSYVLLKSGDGGDASTGAGGNGGNISLDTMNLAAGVNIELGQGGDGFTAGGNGASFTKGTFAPTEGAVPFGLNLTGTQHRPLQIGSSSQVDFNGDGIGDYVYTSQDPYQIVVVLGDQTNIQAGTLGGGTKVYLQGPSNVVGVQVGDFNNDGHDDIAVASNDAGGAGGITVFLNQYNSTNTAFVGFELGRYSPLPTLNKTEATTLGWARSSNSISSIAAGDFDGDGATDIAAIATYTNTVTLTTSQLLLVMKNDVENGRATGRFYGDFGIKGAGDPQIPRVVLGNGGPGTFIVKASVAQVGATFDLMFVANTQGGTVARTIRTYQLGPGIVSPTPAGSYTLGQVDTNRNLPQGNNANINPAAAESLDFTILDFGGAPAPGVPAIPTAPDGVADLAVLLTAPAGYVVTLLGDSAAPGNGLARAASNPNPDGQNSGIFFGAPAGGNGGFNVGTTLVGIRTADVDADGVFDDIAVLNYSLPNQAYAIEGVSVTGADANNGLGDALNRDIDVVVARDNSVIAFDTYIPERTVAGHAYVAASPTKDTLSFQYVLETGAPTYFTDFTPLVENSINITTGDGGGALVGRGGVGGAIGGGFGSISINLPRNPAFAAELNFNGGRGGDGFSTGGAGGKVSGISVAYVAQATTLYADVSLRGGDGGRGVAGAGGRGGSVTDNTIESGVLFAGGDGGSGNVGGAGGDVVGNGRRGVFDTADVFVEANGGNGGAGVRRGGDGGSVINFRGQYITPVGSTRGAINYTGGDGGNAASGPGGRGGSVTKSSPLDGVNAMSGEIYLEGGSGGSGTVGGAGGSISDFINNPSVQNNPTIVSILGGNGGNGTSGNGGVGGGITNVSTPSVGRQDPQQQFVSGYLFNRIVAGNGGTSGSGNGGAGGSITKASVSSSDGAIAFIAGAGGSGLRAGGAGGSIINSDTTNGPDSQSKILVVAGAGGDAFASQANPLDAPQPAPQKLFGGTVGKGGNGGNITGFTQSIGVQAKVDLIAGNGGGTVNYGTILSKSFVGRGGSISGVTIAGNIGSGHAENVTGLGLEVRNRANIPIKSYTDIDGNGVDDTTMKQFVQNNFRFRPTDTFAPFVLDDTVGNVGVIVGSAGRIKTAETSPGVYTTRPAFDGVNGNLTNVSARNMLSAVAGSINQVAAIQAVSGLRIGTGSGGTFEPGIVGSDKDPTLYPLPFVVGVDPTPGSVFDYQDLNGQGVLEAQVDGRLIDGALVAKKVTGFIAGRVFLR